MSPADARNLDGYGAPLIEWARVQETLKSDITQAPDTGGPNRHTVWLATSNPDGSPHVMPVGALWVDDGFHFTSGPGTRKSKNLANDPRCVLSIATHDFDLVLEGEAEKVTDEGRLQRVADVFGADGEWKPEVEDGAFVAEFSAPSAGPPPWHVYRLGVKRVYALGTAEPYGATRFDF
jgi:hypothetical protein